MVKESQWCGGEVHFIPSESERGDGLGRSGGPKTGQVPRGMKDLPTLRAHSIQRKAGGERKRFGTQSQGLKKGRIVKRTGPFKLLSNSGKSGAGERRI